MPNCIGSTKVRGDPWKMLGKTNWDLDSLGWHAHGHKKRRRLCPISRPQFRRKLWEQMVA